MSVADWYIALFSLGSGVGILAFWTSAIRERRVADVASGRHDIWFHITAELTTAALLVGGAIAIFIDANGRATAVISTFGLASLLYSLIQSPGHYVAVKDKRMVATFLATGLFAVPAMILRFLA